jgi:hypothetical protein
MNSFNLVSVAALTKISLNLVGCETAIIILSKFRLFAQVVVELSYFSSFDSHWMIGPVYVKCVRICCGAVSVFNCLL